MTKPRYKFQIRDLRIEIRPQVARGGCMVAIYSAEDGFLQELSVDELCDIKLPDNMVLVLDDSNAIDPDALGTIKRIAILMAARARTECDWDLTPSDLHVLAQIKRGDVWAREVGYTYGGRESGMLMQTVAVDRLVAIGAASNPGQDKRLKCASEFARLVE